VAHTPHRVLSGVGLLFRDWNDLAGSRSLLGFHVVRSQLNNKQSGLVFEFFNRDQHCLRQLLLLNLKSSGHDNSITQPIVSTHTG